MVATVFDSQPSFALLVENIIGIIKELKGKIKIPIKKNIPKRINKQSLSYGQ